MSHLHSEDKKLFLDTLNKKGFLLEERAFSVFEGAPGYHRTPNEKNKIITPLDDPEGRIEIDVMAYLGNKNYVVECKKTDYSWVFAKPRGKKDMLHIMWNVEDHAIVVSARDTEDFQSASSHLSVVFKEDGRLAKDSHLARTSYKDADDAVKQVLKNTRAYLIDCQAKNVVLKHRYVIPLIVTNNPILLLQYDESKINENADLQDEPLVEEVEGIIYNYPEAFGFENSTDEWKAYGDGVIKSVFITSLKNLHRFLEVMDVQSLSYGKSGRPPAKTFGMSG